MNWVLDFILEVSFEVRLHHLFGKLICPTVPISSLGRLHSHLNLGIEDFIPIQEVIVLIFKELFELPIKVFVLRSVFGEIGLNIELVV